MTRIDKFYFMIHPTCWSQQGDEGVVTDEFLRQRNSTPGRWYGALNWERQVNDRQMDLISRLGANEAMVIYPIGQSAPMLRLLDHAQRRLGERCIVQQAAVKPQPAVLDSMSEPIRHFLDDPQMDGRDEFWSVVPPPVRDLMKDEIRETCRLSGYDWQPSALKVIQGNRLFAAEIAHEIRERGLEVDPDVVRAEAFGEGFEQCAMTWKSMVAHYLGWRHPIENNFDLSVSGFPILFDADFRKRIQRQDHVRIFLWEKSRRRPLALFARAQCLLTDSPMYVKLPLGDVQWEIWKESELVWPAERSPLRASDGFLHVPVYASIRKSREDGAYYIMGPSESAAEVVTSAHIETASGFQTAHRLPSS